MLVLLLFLLGPGVLYGQVHHLRNLFFEATDPVGIEKFYAAAQALTEGQMLNKAYKGTATAMYAGTLSSVFSKYAFFKRGKALLEEAVSRDPQQAEIRFLRFAIQSETPSILGYTGNITEDARLIADALEQGKIDPNDSFWKKALSFMKDSKKIQDTERKRLLIYLR